MLWYIYIALIGLNLAAAALRWKQLSPPVRVLSGLMTWVFFIEIARQLSGKETNILLTHINLCTELVFQFAYFCFLLHKDKRLYLYGGAVFFCTALFVTWNVLPGFFRERNYLDAVFLGVCITVWCGLFFYELIQKPLQHSLKSDGNFWANCGNILFYPGTLLTFGLSSYLEQVNPELRQSLKPINYVLNLALYSLYLTAFCLERRQAPATEAASAQAAETLLS